MRCVTLVAWGLWTAATTSHATDAATTIACARTRIEGASARAWRVACADGSAAATFDPSRIQRFVLTRDAVVRVAEEEESHQVLLSSTLDRVGPLVSSTITRFSLAAEPLWVHKTPVYIAPTAFANLTALETLTLQDVPLANPSLHLVLPRTTKKVVIVGCRLESFTFEVVEGGNASSLLEIDLHSNDLLEIPSDFYALSSNVVNLDIRLNKLSAITVPDSHSTTLKEWMKNGILQIDNLKGFCPHTGKRTQVQGLSQTFDVCVMDTSPSAQIDGGKEARSTTTSPANTDPAEIPNVSRTQGDDVANEAVDIGLPPASVHSPREESGEASPKPRERPMAPEESVVTKNGNKFTQNPAIYVAVICLGVVSALLLTFSFVLVVARYRQQSHQKKSQPSFLTSLGSEDIPISRVERYASDAGSSVSDSMVVRPMPDFSNTRGDRSDRSSSQASASATSINQNRGNDLYTTMHTPHGMTCGYVMSKSLRSLTGVSQFAITSIEKECELRQSNKDKMRAVLSTMSKTRGAIEVNKTIYVCHGEIVETEAGAFMMDCHPAGVASEGGVTPLLALKVYVEQDVRAAIKEYRALLVMQSNTCKQFVSQMVGTDMEKNLDGLKCAVIVVERGSPTTLRHVVRGQIDRTKQFEVVQQLYAVVKALECLHERQFIHGGLHLDALVLHPSEAKQLKFQDLEHAVRFGDTISGTTPTILFEYLPPEMARHLVCSGEGLRPSNMDTMTADSYVVLRASASYDVWCLGVMILKIYANTKHLDEFDGCTTLNEFCLKLSDEAFNFERSLELYVHHDEVRDLARLCLRRDPRKRPKLAGLLNHRVFRAYDRLGEGDLVSSFLTHRLNAANQTREVLPPALWFFLPPRDLGLSQTRTVDEWVSDIANYQQHQRQAGRFRSGELMFPVVFLCENSQHINSPCSGTGYHNSRLYLPASLLSLAMPLVQESTLFLEAKSIISQNPKLSISQVSGLGFHQWVELIKFYRALEKMMLAPMSSFSLLLLKPLEEMLAKKDPEQARQVLDELKCLIFSQEKRDHVLSLLDILKTISINSDLDESDQDEEDADLASVSEDGDGEGTEGTQPTKEWSRLRKCEMASEHAASMPPTRWLCRRHWECEMECEV